MHVLCIEDQDGPAGAEHNALPFQRAVLDLSISISLTEIPMAAFELDRAVQGRNVMPCSLL
jgi:hypothetical protein